MNKHSLISIDLAKNVFQVCLLNKYGKPIVNKKVRRNQLLQTVQQMDAPRVVLEACYSANHWGRQFEKAGFTVDLIPPHQVKPFVVGNKNDHNDALAIAEAAMRPRVSLIKAKSIECQDLQCLFRIRDRLIKTRTAVTNQLRGFLSDYGIVMKRSMASLRKQIPQILEDATNDLTMITRGFVHELYLEIICLDDKIDKKDRELLALLKGNENYRRLTTIPGIGPIIAGHMIAAIGDPKVFKNGRAMAAWCGLTPKQHASGDQSRMVGISKRGNSILRRQLVHGARAVVNHSKHE